MRKRGAAWAPLGPAKRPAADAGALFKCFGCKTDKPPEEFSLDARRPSGLHARCRACLSRYSKKYRKRRHAQIKARERQSYYRIDEDPARKVNRLRLRFKTSLKYMFGIDVETYARMAHAQNLECAICCDALLLDRNTHLDHCHATDRLRGLLCGSCNLMLGGARDAPRILTAAVQYLGRYRAT